VHAHNNLRYNRTARQWQNLTTQDELDELAALEEAMAM
jgi:hypothetical protein